MYESQTYETILARMLATVPDSMDKREGSIIYDALAPAAFELAQAYVEMDVILNETFADTASRTYLIKRAAERGIIPEPATNAILKGVFSFDAGKTANVGDRFSLDTLNYIITEKVSDTEYKLKCETAGIAGNTQFGALVPITFINGLKSATLTELLIPGEDDEDTEVFRARYLASFNNQAYGGNIADYKQKTKTIQGVGGVKVYPVWNGGGTVKVVVVSTTFSPPTAELIDLVQTTLDPTQNNGEGLGVAPIGHVVTVEGATTETINLAATVLLKSGVLWDNVKSDVETMLDAYYLDLAKSWESLDNVIVRVSQIESRMIEIAGILDVYDMSINGTAANYTTSANSVPVRGEFNVTAG